MISALLFTFVLRGLSPSPSSPHPSAARSAQPLPCVPCTWRLSRPRWEPCEEGKLCEGKRLPPQNPGRPPGARHCCPQPALSRGATETACWGDPCHAVRWKSRPPLCSFPHRLECILCDVRVAAGKQVVTARQHRGAWALKLSVPRVSPLAGVQRGGCVPARAGRLTACVRRGL